MVPNMANQERAKKGLDNPIVHDTGAIDRTAGTFVY